MIPVKSVYKNRFSKTGIKRRDSIWKTLCSSYFQKFIKSSDVVLDLGAGYCEFINNIECNKKYAVDINPDTKKYANSNVEVIGSTAQKIPHKLNGKIDVVFMSNFLEHLNSKEEVHEVIRESKRLLRKNGKLIILQPNIDLVKEKYWDFFDHKTALNESSLRELMELEGFSVKLFIKRFLPYSAAKNVLPTPVFAIKFYLKIPSVFRPRAGQSLLIASKK